MLDVPSRRILRVAADAEGRPVDPQRCGVVSARAPRADLAGHDVRDPVVPIAAGRTAQGWITAERPGELRTAPAGSHAKHWL
jgi:hypothetical protein